MNTCECNCGCKRITTTRKELCDECLKNKHKESED